MKNGQEDKLAILKSVNGKEITKKELEELGISGYYIKVFMESDVISRVSRGVYKVSFAKNEELEQTRKIFQYFNRFKYKVLDGRYIEAYHALMENFHLQNSHNYDNHMRIYFILLKELIGSKYDFSPLDELYEFTEEKTDTYYDYFIAFREEIMKGNFYDAKAYLEKFALEETKVNGFANVSTTLFTNLLEDVLKKIEDSYNTQVKRDTFTQNYHTLVNAIISEDYDLALKKVEACIFSAKTTNMSLMMKRIRQMLNDLMLLNDYSVDMRGSRVDYSKAGSVYYKLDWAIKAKDYSKANIFVDEILTMDNRGRYKTIKRLIEAILKQISINNDIKRDTEVDVETLKKMNSPLDTVAAYKAFLHDYEAGDYENALYNLEISLLKEKMIAYKDNKEKMVAMLRFIIDMEKNKHGFKEMNVDYSDANTPILIFNKALVNQDYKMAFKNIGKITYQNNSKNLALFKSMLHNMYELDKKYGNTKEQGSKIVSPLKQEKKKLEVNEALLEDYVNEGRYDELYILLGDKKHTKSLNRLENTVYKLIKIYKTVDKGFYERPNHVYETNERDYLGTFFEAIRCEDIYTAYGELACIYGNVQNQKEFDIFEVILRDAVDKQEEILKNRQYKELENEVLRDINNIISNKDVLTNEEIDQIYDYLSKLQDGSVSEIIDIIADITSTIDLANNSQVDYSYFADLSKPETFRNESQQNTVMEELEYLKNGDYANAFLHIKDIDSIRASKLEKNILRRLLMILNRSLNKTYEPIIRKSPAGHLANIKRFIKKYDFYQAFNYIMTNNLSSDLLEDIFPLIFESMTFTLIMHEDLYKEFNEAIKMGDMNKARIAMSNYKEEMDKTSLGDSEASQVKYEEMNKKLKK